MKKRKAAKWILVLLALSSLASCSSSGKSGGKKACDENGVCHIGDK